MNIRFLPLARQELDDAFAWYQLQAEELGFDFLDELDRVVRRIRVFPKSCAVLVEDLRRAQLSRFPYGVIYGLEPDGLVVVAVAHLHREPRYWMDRER